MIRQIVVRSHSNDQGQKTLSKRLSEGYRVVMASEYIPADNPYIGAKGFIEYILEIELPEEGYTLNFGFKAKEATEDNEQSEDM